MFKISTRESDEHRAVAKAGPIIAGIKDQIRTARATLTNPVEAKAEELAAAYRARQSAASSSAQVFVLSDVIAFVLRQQGHSWADYGRQVRDVGYDAHTALRLLPGGDAVADAVDAITNGATPFLKYLDEWKPHASLKPRPLDQAISTLKEFAAAVKQPIERLEAKHVQAWIDGLINPDGADGLTAVTVGRKLSELRNYWRYLQSRQIVPEDKLPFANRRVKDPAARRKTKDEKRQRFRTEDVVRPWDKTTVGFDGRFVFHSIRTTVAALFQDAGCKEEVAADIIGHNKPTMTYGLYGGETRMDLRAIWLAKAIRYPLATDDRRPTQGRTETDPQQA